MAIDEFMEEILEKCDDESSYRTLGSVELCFAVILVNRMNMTFMNSVIIFYGVFTPLSVSCFNNINNFCFKSRQRRCFFIKGSPFICFFKKLPIKRCFKAIGVFVLLSFKLLKISSRDFRRSWALGVCAHHGRPPCTVFAGPPRRVPARGLAARCVCGGAGVINWSSSRPSSSCWRSPRRAGRHHP